ncbi:MAG: hypothetical protein HY529_01555 [Chloroflexi bacterium]|nr:hypothetical protein [Chloroflexota bacterium]
MCDLCGCQEFIKKGQESIRKRSVEIVKELRLAPNNIDDYECTEAISGMIAPFGNRDDEVYHAASWISGLHQSMSRLDRDERYQKHAHAFRDLFARLPVKGDPKHITTTYHQLEQLARELDEKSLASLDSETRRTIDTVNHIHEDRTRQARLKERYGL